jgi:LemA protein
MIALWVLLGVGIALILWVVGIYNSLVALRQGVQNAWSQIDVQLKRRHDLISNLVESVKGYMTHERGTLERVVQARSQAMQASSIPEKAQAESLLTQSLRSLWAVSERYPNLKASANILSLQEELASTENRIAFSRQVYNDQVMRYNTAIQTVPSNTVAGLAGFTKSDFFHIEDLAQRQTPAVKF